jgi:2-haloacid dehalogenase
MTRRDFLAGTLAAGTLPLSFAERAAAGGAPLPPELQSVRMLVFDTFGTVVDWRSGIIAEGEALGRTKGFKVPWPEFADAWRGGYGPSMNRVRKGELPWTKLDRLHRMILDELLVRFKMEGLSEQEKDHLNRAWHRLNPWPDAVAGLTRLRKRFVIAPLSNGNVSLLTNMAKHGGIPWDCIMSTELVRHYKPDPETYRMPAEFFDLEPPAVMMVAAHSGDLQSAKAVGLRTAYVHRPLEFGRDRPDRAPQRPPSGQFDLICKDFVELAAQLGT